MKSSGYGAKAGEGEDLACEEGGRGGSFECLGGKRQGYVCKKEEPCA